MARSKLDTLVYSTILVAPMAVAIATIATAPGPQVIVETADCPATADPPVVVDAPPVVDTPPTLDPAEEPTPPATAEPPPAGAGVLLFERRLVLSTEPDTAWAHGALRNHANEYGLTVSKSVDPARLPGFLGGLAGRRFSVFAADGSSCVVDAGPLSIYARVDGEVSLHDEDGSEASPAEHAALRQRMFLDHAELLIARPEGNPRCDGLWARAADMPAPAVYGARPLAEDDAKALAAELAPVLAAQPAVVALQAEYTAWYAETGAAQDEHIAAWPAFYRDEIEVRRWDEVGGATTHYTVDVGAVGEACSGMFTGHASFVLTRDGAGWRVHEDPGFWRPQALMDLDRDGHLEAVTAGGRSLESRGPDHGLAQSFEIPWWGCPC